MTLIRKIDLATNDLGRTAWGIPKVSEDRTLFHGMWSYNVPITVWKETLNGVQQPITNSVSVDGGLNIIAGATLNDKTNLKTYRNLRYEPNRGFLYSTAAIIINPTASMRRSFGVATAESGVFFLLKTGGLLVGVVRTTRAGITTEDELVLDVTGVDFSKGNVFDIQYQWRGVGNYKFFINLKEVGNTNYLGTLTELSMNNPSNPIFFESENLGANDKMIFGCVDVTSEGGSIHGEKSYGSVGISNQAGEVSITGFNIPVIVLRSKEVVSTLINTRDTLVLSATGYADQRSVIRVWKTRDFTAIVPGTNVLKDFGDGHLEYIEYDPLGTPMTFDIAKAELVFTGRIKLDDSFTFNSLFEGNTNLYLTPGDMFIFTMHRETGGAEKAGITVEFAEEI